MARNIGDTSCNICEGTVLLEESERPITAEECGDSAAAYMGRLTVANARCRGCGALYLAWVRIKGGQGRMANPRGDAFVDLSFRTSFNSEPAPSDLPSLEKLRELADHNRRASIQNLKTSIAKMQRDIADLEAAMGGPCFWEVYLR